MKRSVFKYMLAISDEIQAVSIPGGGRVVHAGSQDGHPCLWVDVEPDAPERVRRFIVKGTGHPVHEHAEYIGTCFTHGQFVWHIFEDLEA